MVLQQLTEVLSDVISEYLFFNWGSMPTDPLVRAC